MLDELPTPLPPSAPHSSPSLARLFLKTTLLSLGFLFIFFILSLAAVSIYAKHQLDLFTQAAGISQAQLISTVKAGWKTVPAQDNQKVNFLILGTDDLANRGQAVQLTDTMLLASLNLKTGQVSMYSLPRDLWLDDYKTKINALYEYGKQRYPEEPQRFPREVLQQLTSLPIHHTLMINLDTLASLVDTIGGIDIHVQDSFSDTKFPRPDVDVTKVHDPALLYMTVEFHQGVEHMSGQRVLEYVRSRHSASEQEGNDVARGQRQQEVILDVINTLKNPSFFRDIPRAGRLYRFYQTHFSQFLGIPETIGLAKILYPLRNQIHFESSSPSIYPDNPEGMITHPRPSLQYQNQWVYIIRNPELFKKEVNIKLQ